MRRILRILKWGGMAVLIVMMLLVLLPLVLPRFGWQVDPVYSGSMEPAIPVGALAVSRQVDPYEDTIASGDIIIYRHPMNESRRVSHRVVEIEYLGLQPNFQTKGDANEDPDPYLVYPSYVEGVMKFHVPYLGYFINFARTRLGLILLLVVPGALLIAVEMRNIWSTLARLQKPKADANADANKEGTAIE